MANTELISDVLAALRIEGGRLLLKARDGGPLAEAEEKRLGEILATVDGLHFTAKALLSEDDHQQFLYRSGCSMEEVEESLARLNQNLKPI